MRLPLISWSSVGVAQDQTVLVTAQLSGKCVLSAAHVMVSVARAQTELLYPCLDPSDRWQRLLTGGSEEFRGEPEGHMFSKSPVLTP